MFAASPTRVRRPALVALTLALTFVAAVLAAPAGSAGTGVAAGPRHLPAPDFRSQPVTLENFSQVSTGGEYACGLRAPGALWCWGRNNYGQLGRGSTGQDPMAPAQVGSKTNWAMVAAGGSTTCAIRAGGSLFCWGLNHRGQVGNGRRDTQATPKKLHGPKDWTDVAVGWFHTCGIRGSGRLRCWGDNAWGELGRGNTKQDLKAHTVKGTWRTVDAAGSDTCGIKRNGSLWCWGRNLFGQLGNGTFGDAFKPVKVGKAKDWVDVELSWTHACGLEASGAVSCWGRNDLGQVGQGADIYAPAPFAVPGGHVATAIAVADGTSCLLDQKQSVWCWGDNRYGQISPDAPATAGNVVPVQHPGSYKALASSGGWFYFCGVTPNDASSCWGSNEQGQLGAPNPAPRSAPPAAKPTGGAAHKDGPLTFRIAAMNTLGNHHTRPFADADRFGPSRMRADWTAQALLNNGVGVSGLEEQDPGQLQSILNASMGRYASWQTPQAADVESAIVWDTTQFELVEGRTVKTVFIKKPRLRPLVRLRQISTGREFWVMNVHNAGWNDQKQRNAAVKVQLATINELEASGLPIFYTGDFNEKKTIFCKVREQTSLVAASGGRISGKGDCIPPRGMRVDWIFGPSTAQWSGFQFMKPPLVRLSTDHYVPVADVTVP